MFSPGAATMMQSSPVYAGSCKAHAQLFPMVVAGAFACFSCPGKSSVAFVRHLTDNLTDW
jgi:hypothetical protein